MPPPYPRGEGDSTRRTETGGGFVCMTVLPVPRAPETPLYGDRGLRCVDPDPLKLIE